MSELIVFIPTLPDRRLGPNKSRSQHWGQTTKLKNELKIAALGGVLECLQNYRQKHGECWKLIQNADLTITVVNGTRKMDRDNTIACLKYAIDMTEKRIIQNDSGYEFKGVSWIRDKRYKTGIYFKIEEI